MGRVGPSCLINIGRGSIVDLAAPLQALRERTIAGAVLDVFEEEPLLAHSPFWGLDSVIVTPHVAGRPAGYVQRGVEVFADNVSCWRCGEPLRNVIDFQRRY